jgi:hypothetical protein
MPTSGSQYLSLIRLEEFGSSQKGLQGTKATIAICLFNKAAIKQAMWRKQNGGQIKETAYGVDRHA